MKELNVVNEGLWTKVTLLERLQIGEELSGKL